MGQCHLVPVQGYSLVESYYDVSYIARGDDDHRGAGTFGQVRMCTHRATKQNRCVKTIPKNDWSTRGYVMEEIEINEMVAGKHPNIVEYFEFFEEWDVVHLIFEFCHKGNLDQFVHSSDFQSGGQRLAAKLTCQIASALSFLKGVKIVHRDVKPSNLLFKETELVKLGDFGSACVALEPLEDFAGSPAFFAPEIHQLPRGKGYSFPVDIWALGICCYMMLFQGTHPFMEKGVLRKRAHHAGAFEAGWFTSWKLNDFLEWMLMPYPGQRITPEEVPEHKWCSSFGLGKGSFSREKRRKVILDSYGNWVSSY